MLTAIAVDDEPGALEVVQLHASKVPFLELKATFTNAFVAMRYLQENKIDLIFLDIKMPDISGIEFINCLQQVPMIVFTTAYAQYAVEGFELSATEYLLKPFSLARFTKACNKALENKNLKSKGQDNYLFIKTGYEEEKILLADIQYIEAEGNYLTFVLTNRRVLSRQTMADILKVLPLDYFFRVHRSYIIALTKVEKIGRQEITVAGKSIPIGVSYEESIGEIRKRL